MTTEQQSFNFSYYRCDDVIRATRLSTLYRKNANLVLPKILFLRELLRALEDA